MTTQGIVITHLFGWNHCILQFICKEYATHASVTLLFWLVTHLYKTGIKEVGDLFYCTFEMSIHLGLRNE
jgi:hypothetical protein